MPSKSISSSESDLSISSTSTIDIDFRGIVLKQKYVLIYKLGSGTFSTVWLGYDIQTGKYYAIKMQNPDDYYNGEREVELFKKFKSKECSYINILVDSFDYEIDDDVYICMVCDLLAGSTFDLINSGKYNKGLPVDVVKKIIHQLLIAMDYLNKTHKKIHTDIKPENILVVGVSEKIKEVISRFEKCEFDKIYKKKKAQSKRKKKGKNNNSNPLEATLKEVFNKLDLDDLETSDSETSEASDEDSERSTESSNTELSSNEEDDVQIIDDKYLSSDNIMIKLSDFGSCLDINNKSYRIQTRYYRSPEVLLEYKLNVTCDIWSVGCTLYELLTGSILFDPDKKRRFNRNRYHIYEIQSKLGRIPDYLLKNATKRSVYFKNNGLMKGKLPTSANYVPLSSVLLNKLKQTSTDELYLIIDLLYKMLEYDPNKRPTSKECLSHPWFNVEEAAN